MNNDTYNITLTEVQVALLRKLLSPSVEPTDDGGYEGDEDAKAMRMRSASSVSWTSLSASARLACGSPSTSSRSATVALRRVAGGMTGVSSTGLNA